MTAPAKPRSEAAQIITRLQFSGMKRAEIARQLGVTAATISNISRGLSSGDSYLVALRNLHSFNPKPASNSNSNTSNDAAPVSTPATPEPTQAVVPAIEVADGPTDDRTAGAKLKDSIKDAILGKSGGQPFVDAKKAGSKSGGANSAEDLLQQLVPLAALALVILSYAPLHFFCERPRLYEPVIPKHDEAAMIVTPLLRIMLRNMDATGTLNETQLDLLQFVLATGVYAQRAWSTASEIRERNTVDASPAPRREQPRAQPVYAQPVYQPAPGAASGASAAPFAHAGSGSPHFIAGAGNSPTFATPSADGSPTNAGQPGQNDVGKHNPFASIELADAIGRARLGIN